MATDRYTDTPIVNDTGTGKRVYATTIFPSIPTNESDVFIVTRFGDRLDLLASRFYGDSSLWWIIGGSNGLTDSFFVPSGTKLRIPMDVQFALSYVNQVNLER